MAGVARPGTKLTEITEAAHSMKIRPIRLVARHLHLLSLAGCVALGAAPTLSHAQTGAAASRASPASRATDDIVVTAGRRPQSETALAATVDIITARRLEAESIRTFDDLARADTSLQISAYQGETQLFLRGIGAVTFIGGFESSIAVNLDGVYLGRPTAIAPALFDTERVEILKGPQGTLYGRNATGGAINLITRAPTSDWQADASATLGNYNRRDLFAGVSGPLASGVNFRVALGSNNHDGFTRLHLGSDAAGNAIEARAESRHETMARARLDWALGASTELQFSGDYYRADDRGVVFHFAGPGYANNPLFLERIGQGDVGDYGERRISASLLPFNKPENWGLSARLVTNLRGPIFSATSSLRRTRPRNLTDMSNSTVLGESQFKAERATQVSQEFELRSAEGARINYLVGFTYYRERNNVRNEFFIPDLVTYLGGTGSENCCLLRANGSVRTESYALFGEVGGAILPSTRVTIGGRLAREGRSGRNLLDFTGYLLLNDTILEPVTFTSFTPRLVVEHDIAALGRLYASATKGFKAGGFNVGSGQNSPYSPESIWSYEIGAKLQPAPGWFLTASAFHYDYRNLQVQDVDRNTVLIRNAATAKVDGIEIESRWSPGGSLYLGAMASWLDARFSRYATLNTKRPELGVVDLSGNPLPQAPRWRFGANAEYEIPVDGIGALRLRADAAWQDRIFFSAFKDPRASQKAYWWLKARATLLPEGSPFRVSLFVDNLTNSRAFTNISITGDLDASRALGNLAPPRTWGLELRYSL